MTDFQPANPWTALQGDAKTYIGLAASLLAVTATFADRLIGDDRLGRLLVVVAWGVLGLTILCASFASGEAYKGIEGTSTDTSKATGLMGATVLLLALGTGLLAASAWRSTTARPESTDVDLGELAVAAVSDVVAAAPADSVTLVSFERNADGTVSFVVAADASETMYLVILDDGSGVLRSVEPQSDGAD